VAERLRVAGWSVLAAGRADGDVARPDQARALVKRAVSELGGLNLLVNAAAEGFAPKSALELTEADWDLAFGATAKGTFFVTQAAAPHLRQSRGTVVMLEDVAAYQPWPSFAAHCSAKAAQAMLTRVFARALAPEECSDGELLQRIAAGDRAAFDVLYRRFVRPVFALALRRLGDRGRAEDATQETFASVWRSATSYRAERGAGAPWLYAVARNA